MAEFLPRFSPHANRVARNEEGEQQNIHEDFNAILIVAQHFCFLLLRHHFCDVAMLAAWHHCLGPPETNNFIIDKFR